MGDGEYCLEKRVLPIDVWKLCSRLGVKISYDEYADGWDGVCFLKGKAPLIVIKSGLLLDIERYIVAHELGHLLLGHVGAWGGVADRPYLSHREQEREALAFAIELIMPKELLALASVDEIQERCGVRRALASFRYKTLSK